MSENNQAYPYNNVLYIIAAGKGSRMGGSVPKALVPINDEPNLTTMLRQVGHKFDAVYVVTNELIQDQWKKYFMGIGSLGRNVINISISSGLGDGHAVLQALSKCKDPMNDIVICWGDVFMQHHEIIDELLSQSLTSSGLIPAVREENPYVSLLVDDKMNCVSADFSKYGENHPTGFHDQSIFRFKKSFLQKALGDLHAAFWKNGRYITPGGELSLLHAFHYLYNREEPARVYETDYPTLSFNTREEVAHIQSEINSRMEKNNAP